MLNFATPHSSWRELLVSPARPAHIVQLYDRDEFLAAGVAFFAAEGLRRGEAVLLTGTQAHLRGIQRALAALDVDPDAVMRDGRLRISDVHQAVAGDALESARGDGRFTGVRWWGEMSNVLQQQGKRRAAMAAEGLGDAAAKKYGIALFCSFLCDKFDPRGYDGILRDVCGAHSHVIPAEDYVRHRLAVNRAIAEVVGDLKGSLLQSLRSWNGFACDMPSSQAMLFWVRDAMPEHFDAVLSRTKAYEAR